MPGKSYEVYVQKGTPLWKVVTNILFSHVGLFILVIGYCAVGAKIFMDIEEEREMAEKDAKLQKTDDVDKAIDFLKQSFWQYGTNEAKYNYTKDQFKLAVLDDLTALKRYILDAHSEAGYDGTRDFSRDFSFESTVLFTITIMSTVGYGHIAPATTTGRLFCILYSLIGIPLLLVFMSQIGDWMAISFRWLYSRILCRWCRARRRDSELPPSVDRRSRGIGFDEIGKERYMPTDLVMVPIMVNLMLIFGFIFMGAILFASWEGWSPTTAAYFCFVTLTTIGFGDYTPVKSFNGFEHDPVAAMKMVFTVSYCIFGMTLLSMCMNLMQEQIVEKVSWVAAELGMSGDGNDEEIVKLSIEGKVQETPEGKDGNKTEFGFKKEKREKSAV